MVKSRRNVRRGGGFLTDQQYFDPDVLPPSSLMPPLSTAPTGDFIRPVLLATAPTTELMAGGGGARTRRARRVRGGFSPSVMGSFVANAQAAIVPAALYLIYNQFVPKVGSNSVPVSTLNGAKGRRSGRRATRRAGRR